VTNPQITTDLATILERIEVKIDKQGEQLNNKIDSLQKDVTDIKIELATTKSELKGEIKTLDEKITGLSKRVDSVDFINRGVFVALIIAILGAFAKIFGLVGNSP
jgi:chromosome segregation ATPase